MEDNNIIRFPVEEILTKSKRIKYIQIEEIKRILEGEISLHKNDLAGVSGKGVAWEHGFVAGLSHVLTVVKKLRDTPNGERDNDNY